ncbi:MAG TPA: hypothetical protein PK405_07140, partial [Hyphomicrobiales bacterium]|nr:hypothetical protein [Hyphomicrobiales bacterium]
MGTPTFSIFRGICLDPSIGIFDARCEQKRAPLPSQMPSPLPLAAGFRDLALKPAGFCGKVGQQLAAGKKKSRGETMLTGDMLRRSAERFPSKPAILWNGTSLSYLELD